MQTLYRVANKQTEEGLWYQKDGTYSGLITRVEGALCQHVPMAFDPSIRGFLSACDNTSDMSNWFSLVDLKNLYSRGYRLYRLGVTGYNQHNGHAIFLPDLVVSEEEVDVSLICKEWDASNHRHRDRRPYSH